MKALFLKSKPSMVLLLMKDSSQSWYPSKLARAASCSYVHTVNLLARLRGMGIVTVEKKGRQNLYWLTERGMQLASLLDEFSKKCDSAAVESKPKDAAAQQPAVMVQSQEEKKEEKRG